MSTNYNFKSFFIGICFATTNRVSVTEYIATVIFLGVFPDKKENIGQLRIRLSQKTNQTKKITYPRIWPLISVNKQRLAKLATRAWISLPKSFF